MARQRKQQTPRDITLPDNWKVPAACAIGFSVITFYVVPSVANPILKLVTLFTGIALSVFLGLIAIFIFFGRKTPSHQSGAFQHGFGCCSILSVLVHNYRNYGTIPA